MQHHSMAPRHRDQHLLPAVQYLGEGFGTNWLKRLIFWRQPAPDTHREAGLETAHRVAFNTTFAGKSPTTR
ncbi:hypothetical protein [Shimia abyssi]|uniref:Uncharacterized protein n=1 Tax=Shimia abyssi TaxID=1662395 RepID=A0A2P8FJL0_9RHOB|nr:hypothetical protein [Shimia abyssi]PSL21911.1 hypothetical protein CLV88_101335 [Shimia abyssi]